MDINLKNKKAFVCGSTQGIGRAAAIELANSARQSFCWRATKIR
jgi:NAD(P)-dependent dehydrogenase (short-subunit alcohol dehydrogenase family)